MAPEAVIGICSDDIFHNRLVINDMEGQHNLTRARFCLILIFYFVLIVRPLQP